jgi:hypothetical protein
MVTTTPIATYHTHHRKARRRPYVKPGHEWTYEVKRAARQFATAGNRREYEMKAKRLFTSQTALLERAQTAFDVSFGKMADITGHREAYLRGTDHVSLDSDAILERVLAYTNERVGMLLALRLELYRELSRSRTARVANSFNDHARPLG